MELLDSGFGAGLLRVHDPDCGCRDGLHGCRNAVYVPCAHEPVISLATWEAYLRRREAMRPLAPRTVNPAYPLSGLLRCGLGKRHLTITHTGKGGAVVSGNWSQRR